MPKQVLMEHFDSELEIDEPDLETDNNDLYDDEFYNELEAIPKLYSNTTASSARYNSTATSAGFGIGHFNISQSNNSSYGIFAGGGHAFITHSKENYLKGLSNKYYELSFFVFVFACLCVCVCVCK